MTCQTSFSTSLPLIAVSKNSLNIITSLTTSPCMSLRSVCCSSMLLSCLFIKSTVLHPYYKLSYIKMAWGGPEEQKKEQEASNPHTMDWHDEVLKIGENTLVEYWTAPVQPSQGCLPATLLNDVSTSAEVTLESQYDHHHRKLIKQSMKDSNSGGWATELRNYLNDIPVHVARDMDVVEWWGGTFSLPLISNDL